MSRPSDWSPVDMDRDPTPGDPDEVRALAEELQEFADDVGEALGKIRGMAGERAMLDWAGLSADAFRREFDGVPDNLTKLEESYSLCSQALNAYWPKLQNAQGMADRALDRAITAQADLASAQSALGDATDWVGRAGDEAERLQREGERENVEPPDEADVRAATRDQQAAEAAAGAAQARVNDAEERLSAARQLAQDAQEMREEAARQCSQGIEEASDAGIQNRRWWEKAIDWVTDNWDTLVEACKLVVAVLGVVVMIIGGPLAWVVLAAAVIVLADTLIKYARGEAGLLDVAFAALDCIPGMKGITTAAGLAAGVRGLARAGLRGTARNMRDAAVRGRDMLVDGFQSAYTRVRSLIRSGGTDPVDLATGKMFLPQTDVTLPGVLPLRFTRRVEAGYRAGRWFGPSWSSTCDQRLEVDDEGVVFLSDDGMVLTYPPAEEPGRAVLPYQGPRWELARDAEGAYRLTQATSGVTRHFAAPDGRGVGRIVRMTDRHHNTLAFDYGLDGAPTAIRHSGGYHLVLSTDAGRITELRLVGAGEDGTDVTIKRYGYDEVGNLTEVANPGASPLRFTYDEHQRVTSWTDTNGLRYGYTYDERGRCVAEGGDAGDFALTFDYRETLEDWPGHSVTTLTDGRGAQTRYVVNDAFQIVAEISPGGGTTHTEYDANHQLVRHVDPLGNLTRFENNAQGRPVAVHYPDGRTTRYAYNEFGQPTEIRRHDGGLWRREYDDRGNRTAVIDAAGAITRYEYDDAGRLLAVQDVQGHRTTIEHNPAGLPVRITDPLGSCVVRRYDAFGRVNEVIDPLGAVTRMWWTVESRVARLQRPNGAEETWCYDAEGNCLSHVDAAGGVTRYEYGRFDLLSARVEPDGARYTFEHDPVTLQLTKVFNPQGLTWEYAYDLDGRLASETDFDGRLVAYRRDPAGRLVGRTTSLGQDIAFEHDEVGRVLRKDAAGVLTTYDYDAAGMMVRAASPDSEVLWTRDEVGRVVAETVNGRTLSYRYDTAGRRTERVTPGGSTTRHAYDAAGRLTVLGASGHTVEFGHDAAGHEISRLFGDSVTLVQEWEPTSGRLVQQVADGPRGRVAERSYTYRPDGAPIGIDDQGRGHLDLALDPVGRVVEISARDWHESYAYDEAGNQTAASWPSRRTEGTAQGERQYVGTRLVRAGGVHYEYDAAGRVVLRRRTRLSRKPDVWRYTWDAEDRLTSVTTPDGTLWRYTYDPLGRRTAKLRMAADGDSIVHRTLFTWDGSILTEQHTSAPDAPDVVITWDHQGLRPVAQTERLVDAATQEEIDDRFFAIATDLVGTPTELVDESGDVAWRGRATLWGVTSWNRDSAAHTPLRFPGQYHDQESGLHHNHYRYYDPETARYLSRDPLGLGPAPNPVAYVSNPLVWVDPLGLGPCHGVFEHGGNVHYLPLDDYGRATGVDAVLTRSMLNQGSGANSAIHPSGWNGQGVRYNEGRGHLLADRLGGNGDLEENLVTLTQDPTNTPIMRDQIEALVYDAVDAGQTVRYEVRAHYPGPGDIAPAGLSFHAVGDGGFRLDRYLENPAGMFGFGETEQL
ncbi:RHS repeat-associated core domain-containing protein [Streptomyces sp. DSM 44915]|uniref:RHS repeat-associated core domain-containing protein n=1 Tax=Streptomyces chisholmiae TaxID=3075540 RepID=A0ABU2JRT1_9ACTN|nr:RHS repeat-associated core domain-containing protein [Streptomyces sp. DSM 44915]MDT0267680.1 RHS repeat-associated core domain-containing protein [Streptomyces sp. DSM 44915]